MTCMSKTSSALMIPTQRSEPRNRSSFTKAMITAIEAFQEALDMRRAAQSKYLLNDE